MIKMPFLDNGILCFKEVSNDEGFVHETIIKIKI